MLRSARGQLRASRATASPGLFRLAQVSARRTYASLTDVSNFPRPGEQLHGFTLKRVKQVPELELTALHLQHDKTGADYLHIARDDANNVFSIGFKTNPPDATGVPHILEHTTLCGSQKYPIRDPFFKMLPRSLSNFMNAWTFSDHTGYPFATTNVQDFRNLMSVYLDATLHPLLKELDFTQEGWRIGPENPLAATTDDPSTKRLVFKGVVYNEMKGQMSDGNYLFYTKFQEHLFPAINNSGGDPQKITDLTWEQLRKFHADHYHPSNAKILTYGNMPLVDHLKEVNDRLSNFDRISVDQEVKTPIELNEPKHVVVSGPADPLVPQDRQYKTSITWMMGDTADAVENFALGILSGLLTGGYGSPLFRELVESGLGTDFSMNTGYDSAGRRGVFSVGLDGVKAEDVSKVHQVIAQALRKAHKDGFEKKKVDGSLHQLELMLKHKNENFGMSIMQRLQPSWFNGIDPIEALAWQEIVDAFQAKYAEGNYLESLIEKYLFTENNLTFTMQPSETFNQDLVEEENQRLAKKIMETTQRFSSEDEAQQYLEKRELELLEVQEKARTEDLSCLPTLYVKDIPRERVRKSLRHTTMDDVKVQWREAPTNGLTYFRGMHRLHDLPDELRELIPLFTNALHRLGTKNKTMGELEQEMKLKTGGLSFGHHVCQSPTSLTASEEGFIFSAFALDRNIPDMYELMRILIQETNFDGPEAEKKIREILQSATSGAINSVAESGHSYAMRHAASGISPVGLAVEQTSGLAQIKLTAALLSQESLSDVIQKLKAIQSFAMARSSDLRVSLNCGPESATSNQAALQHFLSQLPQSVSVPSKTQEQQYPRTSKSFFPLPYQVYYSARVVPTVKYTDPSSAALEILAKLLTFKQLHPEIREKGGAYGGGAYIRATAGMFGMYSYRDPNPQNSMKIMSEAGQWARDRVWSAQDLEESKLSVFQAYDGPESVAYEGSRLLMSGITDDMMQERRERLLDVTSEQIQQVADEYLVKRANEANVTILGAKQDWVSKDNGWELQDLGMAANNMAAQP